MVTASTIRSLPSTTTKIGLRLFAPSKKLIITSDKEEKESLIFAETHNDEIVLSVTLTSKGRSFDLIRALEKSD